MTKQLEKAALDITKTLNGERRIKAMIQTGIFEVLLVLCYLCSPSSFDLKHQYNSMQFIYSRDLNINTKFY